MALCSTDMKSSAWIPNSPFWDNFLQSYQPFYVLRSYFDGLVRIVKFTTVGGGGVLWDFDYVILTYSGKNQFVTNLSIT